MTKNDSATIQHLFPNQPSQAKKRTQIDLIEHEIGPALERAAALIDLLNAKATYDESVNDHEKRILLHSTASIQREIQHAMHYLSDVAGGLEFDMPATGIRTHATSF